MYKTYFFFRILILVSTSAMAQVEAGKTTNEVFSDDHLNFELAYINKHLGDMEFISENKEAAISYYKKAESQNYDVKIIANSSFYDNVFMLPYFQADLAYRHALVKNGATYWGIKYHQKVLSPKQFYDRFNESFDRYKLAYNTVNNLLKSIKDKDEETQKFELNKLDNLKDAKIASVDDFYADKLIRYYDRSNNELLELNKANIQIISELANDSEMIYEDLRTAEKNISDSFQRYAKSTVLNTLPIGDKQFIESGLKFVETGNVDLMQLVASNANDLDGFYGEIQDAVSVYEKTKKNIETLKNIDVQEFLQKPSLRTFTSESRKIITVLSQYDQTKEFANKLKSDINQWQDSYNAIKTSFDELKREGILLLDDGQNKLDEVRACVSKPSCECVNKISKEDWFTTMVNSSQYLKMQFDKLAKFDCNSFNSIAAQVKEVQNDFANIVNTEDFDYDDAVKLGDLFSVYASEEDKKNWTKVKDTLGQLRHYLVKDSINFRFQKIGEKLINTNPQLKALYKTWKVKLNSGEFDVTNIILEELRHNHPEFYTWLRLFYYEYEVDEINSLDQMAFQAAAEFIVLEPKEGLSKELFTLIFTEFYNDILPLLDAPLQKALRQYLIVSEEKISIDIDALTNEISIRKNGLRIQNRVYTINLKELLLLVMNLNEFDLSRKTSFSNITMKVLSESEVPKIQPILIAKINKIDIHQLTHEVSPKTLSEINNKYIKAYPKKEKKILETLIGNEVFNSNKEVKEVRQVELSKMNSMQSFVRKDSPSLNDEEQAVLMALNYAYPGIGQAVSVVTDVFDNYERIKEINENTKKQKRLAIEIIRNSKTMQYNESQKDLLKKEKEIAKIIADVAKLKSNELDKMLKDANKDEEKYRVLLEEYGLKFLFYHSEILQRDYFLLDKSIRFWYGKSIKDIVVYDADNYRFIYDPDIQLFAWFKDPKKDKSRSDIDGHYLHWELQKSMVENAKDNIFDNTFFDYYAPNKFSFNDLLKKGLIHELKEKELYEINFRELVKNLEYKLSKPNVENLRLIDFRLVGIEKGSGRKKVQISDSEIWLSTEGNGKVINNSKAEFQKLEAFGGSSVLAHSGNLDNMLFGAAYQNELRDNWGVESKSPINGYAADDTWTVTLKSPYHSNFKDFEFSFILIRNINKNYQEFLSEAQSVLLRHADIKDSKIYFNEEEIFETGIMTTEDLQDLINKAGLQGKLIIEKDSELTTITNE